MIYPLPLTGIPIANIVLTQHVSKMEYGLKYRGRHKQTNHIRAKRKLRKLRAKSSKK